MGEIISVEKISEEDFARMGDEWNSLLEESVTNEIFLTWEWIYSWWDAFKGNDKELYILVGKNENNKIIGIAPFYIELRKILGVGSKRIIRLCSSIDTAPDHLDLICKNKEAGLFIKEVFKYLVENGNEWNIIILNGAKEKGVLDKVVCEEIDNWNNFKIERIFESVCPYLELEKNFEDYIRTFSRKKRYNLLREKKIVFEKEGAIYSIANGLDECEDFFKTLFYLHGERAKRKKMETKFKGNLIFNFHRNVICRLAKKGQVVLAIIVKESIPMASCYCLKDDNKYYYYQTGISEEGEKWSAGSVILSLIIEQAFKEGCREFDFLRGDEEYKFFWTKQFRRNYSIIMRKNNLVGKISNNINALFRSLQKFKKMLKHRIVSDFKTSGKMEGS